MVVCLSAVPALDVGGAVGTDPGGAEREPDRAGCAADDRQHRGSRSSSGSGRKRGTPRQGFGRSRGGFTTKIHLRVNAAGLPMRTEITAGQTSDYLGFDLVMADNLPEPSVLLADRGYNSDNIRKTMEVRDVVPVIPMRKTRKLRVAVDRRLYRLRNLVERCFNKLKNARRVATRYDKTAESFLGFIDITSIRLWLRHLST
nr:IS5 family transposase [Paracoccus sp. (in: a-proteobacteria)]